MNKFAYIILGVLFFFVGICIGVWFGLEYVYIEVETIPTKTIFDIITLIFTVIGAVATFCATLLAFFVYFSWNKQQNDILLIQIKSKIISDLISLNLLLSRLFYCFDGVSNDRANIQSEIFSMTNNIKGRVEYYCTFKNTDSNDNFINSINSVCAIANFFCMLNSKLSIKPNVVKILNGNLLNDMDQVVKLFVEDKFHENKYISRKQLRDEFDNMIKSNILTIRDN